ncbi:MAG: uncharacterized protein JWO57_622 [Pseudonocardiales bacterium]|nr:uncharacterized protein [Pseudonocardiales bacterium]
MTVDESRAEQPPDPAQPDSAPSPGQPTSGQLALERYRKSMRRWRLVYLGAILVVVAALATWVGVAWSRGEIAHTTLKTAGTPAASVSPQTPSATLTEAWHTDDRTAIGTPYWGGTVVTFSNDSVRGRNGASGAITWSYTRTDRTVCQAIQDQGVTIAIFELHGNCDQVTALDSATGQRKWTRTLDKDGQPVNGHPTYSVGQYTVLVTTPTVVYAIDPGGGLDRWTFSQSGCTIRSAVIGSQGALISQLCDTPNCAGLKFCGKGEQLLLRDGSASRSDDDKNKANPDQIKWNLVGTRAVPASADQLISAVDPATNELRVLDVTKGTLLHRLSLRGTATGDIAQVATARAELLWISGYTYSVELTGADFFWMASTPGPPSVTPLPGAPAGSNDLNQSSVTAAGSGAIVLLDPGTGKVTRTFSVGAIPAGSRVYSFGPGFVVAGDATAVYR